MIVTLIKILKQKKMNHIFICIIFIYNLLADSPMNKYKYDRFNILIRDMGIDIWLEENKFNSTIESKLIDFINNDKVIISSDFDKGLGSKFMTLVFKIYTFEMEEFEPQIVKDDLSVGYYYSAVIEHNYDNVLEDLSDVYSDAFFKDKIQIEWVDINELSSGQESVLNMYSRIHSLILDEKFKDKKNLVLLLDEPDLYYHPNWKRHFLNDLDIYFNQIFNTDQYRDKSVQIIITSNEPYFISDLPLENIIYLNPNENADKELVDNTFGTNIHNLLLKTFFLEHSIGELALKTINEVVNYLKSGDIDYEKTIKSEYIIEIIGEPIVKRKLEMLYKEKFNDNYSEVEQEINVLEKLKNQFIHEKVEANIINKIVVKIDILKRKIKYND